MKRVTFAGSGEIELTLEADFTQSVEGEPGYVRVQAEGVDVEGENPQAALVYGWYTPREAREIAQYLNEMADRAEAGAR